MTARPRRTKKSDRLLAYDAKNEERQCDYGIAPFDRLATKMENKWGIDRLPELVSPDTAARYGRLMADLMDAMGRADAAEVSRLAQIGIRALHKMDEEATAAGHTTDPEIWEMEVDGFRFCIIRDNRQWPELKKQRPDLVFYTEREVALALKAFGEVGIIEATKKAFPGAEVQKVTPIKEVDHDFWEKGGDEIPI